MLKIKDDVDLKELEKFGFKPKYDDYPSSVYSGITDDPESWGMCCSKEMAYKCAEEYYDTYIRKDKYHWVNILGVTIVLMIPIVMLVVSH